MEDITQTNTTDEAYGAGGNLLARYTGDSNSRSFVPFNGRLLAEYYCGGMIFDHPDEIGSATTATDCTGNNVQERLYYPFGEFWSGAGSLGVHQEFAQLPDYDPETDQYNTSARHYTPMGRWLSPDRMGGHTEDPQTLNKYAYVRNNPTGLTDPSGLDFYLQCTDKDHKGCTQVTIGSTKYWVQADSNGDATIITSNSIRLGQNSATVNGNGVVINGNSEGIYFDNPASHALDRNGNDVDMNPITLQGDASEGFGEFTFNVNGNCGGTCLTSGSFQFAGTPQEARDALLSAGAWDYGLFDMFNSTPLGHHPETDQFRFGAGPSLHVSIPWDYLAAFEMWLVPNPASTVPATGGWHTDESIGYTHFKQANIPGAQ